MKDPNLIVVLGPTASGKTSLAVALADQMGGEIVSADSRQVYRGMDIGTGKDLDEYRTDRGTVPCHLIDLVSPMEPFSVYDYQQAAYRVMGRLLDRGITPILCGGTGLYIDAVLRNYRLVEVPEDPVLRASLSGLSTEELALRLRNLKPDYHTTGDFKKRDRLIRAIEIATHTPRKPQDPEPVPKLRPAVLGVRWPRPVLRKRIRERLKTRIEQGLQEEIRSLLADGVTRDRLNIFGLEYRFGAAYVAGELTRPEFIENLFTAICRFAKRQETWFRGMEKKGVRIHWMEGNEPQVARSLLKNLGMPLERI